ncbi:hypothetical protein LPJ66_011875 [Kickxella alabastrina]|uniref:Uncharacterized protein n=1 Tax=Kickxella alabastrina TaxID=61397 RepID=A0ACC1HX84_9FUNG|nr:hypothetical protein LPJ66_011875 [Kickxella alabastrina]
MAITETHDALITYDLASYAHLGAWKAKPELYLNRYFAQHYYAGPVSTKRKLEETDTDKGTQAESSTVESQTKPKEWQFVYMVPNKLCVVGIANQHPLLNAEMCEEIGNIVKVEFADNVKKSVIKGKGKKQSLRLMPETKICTIFTDSGKEFVVRAAVRGTLMEWNSVLEEDPQLIVRSPEKGFLVIIKPPTDDDSKILSECVAETY